MRARKRIDRLARQVEHLERVVEAQRNLLRDTREQLYGVDATVDALWWRGVDTGGTTDMQADGAGAGEGEIMDVAEMFPEFTNLHVGEYRVTRKGSFVWVEDALGGKGDARLLAVGPEDERILTAKVALFWNTAAVRTVRVGISEHSLNREERYGVSVSGDVGSGYATLPEPELPTEAEPDGREHEADFDLAMVLTAPELAAVQRYAAHRGLTVPSALRSLILQGIDEIHPSFGGES